jgi:DtxR family manganese transport transcriptional regulator
VAGYDRPVTGTTDETGAARRAAAFRATREARDTEIAEDYVELIEDLIAELGEARLTDLAEHMGVSHPTAARIVQRLQRAGLVQSRPYRALFLTDAGRQVAARSRERHRVVQEFLRALGVSERTAEIDSEGMEHHCSEETLAIFARMTERLTRGEGGSGR